MGGLGSYLLGCLEVKTGILGRAAVGIDHFNSVLLDNFVDVGLRRGLGLEKLGRRQYDCGTPGGGLRSGSRQTSAKPSTNARMPRMLMPRGCHRQARCPEPCVSSGSSSRRGFARKKHYAAIFSLHTCLNGNHSRSQLTRNAIPWRQTASKTRRTSPCRTCGFASAEC